MSVGGADNDRAQAIVDEGIDSWNSFVDTDEETIKDLCNEIRRDPNNNVTIPAVAVKRIQLAVYAAKYCFHLVGRNNNTTNMACRLELNTL